MPDTPESSTDTARLLGAWRLVKLNNPGPPAPAGAPPADGLIIYDPRGWMSAQILSPNAAPQHGEATAFHSYFGTYTVDTAATTITHHRVVNNAADAPRDVVREYRFVSDDEIVLAIRGHPGTELTFRRAIR